MTERSAAERIEYRKRNAVDPEAFLHDAGAVRATDDGDLRLTSEFTDLIERRLETLREGGVDTADIATMFGVGEDRVTEVDRPNPAFKAGDTIRNWPSEDALLVDVAVDRTLRGETDDWADVPVRQRYMMLQSLRSFQDECLFCSGPIAFTDEVVELPSGPREVVSVDCDDCERHFLIFSPDVVPTK